MERHEVYRETLESQFRPVEGGTVLVGDSILDFLRNSTYYNRAVGGYKTDDVLGIIDKVGSPEKIVLLVGINDLQAGRSPEAIITNLSEIMERAPAPVSILPLLPVNEAKFRQVILPSNPTVNQPSAEDVARINDWIMQQPSYISTDKLLDNGEIADEYTDDGLHLNGAGLSVLSELF